MKVLMICNRCPFPPADGYMIAVANMLQGLVGQGVDVTLLSMNTRRHFTDISALPAQYVSLCKQFFVDIDNSIKIHKAFLNLFTNDSYNITRFFSAGFESAINRLLSENQFDIVQLEGLNLCLYIDAIRKNSKAKVILRAHNVEYRIWERLALHENNFFRKAYLNLLAGRLKGFETAQLDRLDGIVPITGEDGEIFKLLHPMANIHVSPAGLTPDDYKAEISNSNDVTLFHIGALNWKPNIQGLKWFFDFIWPEINQQHPFLKFFVAGKYTPPWFREINYPNVVFSGFVENASAFMQSHSAMVVPLLAGSGMRIKIIEAMAYGLAVITTTTGCEGIGATHGNDILIADTKDEFISVISKIINDSKFRVHIGENARKFIEANYDNRIIISNLIRFYRSITGNHS